VNPIEVASVVAALAGIAAAGVIGGFVRGSALALEPLPDPLEDRGAELRRSLEDLEEANRAGALEPTRYASLRADTEARIEKVANAIDRRSAVEPDRTVAPHSHRPGILPPWAVAALVGATAVAVTIVGLARPSTPRPVPSVGTASSDPLAFFEQRVRAHPGDLAARLDLAHRYLDLGRFKDALVQYAVVLRLDPGDAEANANIGLIQYLADRPKAGLASVRTALRTDPTYPEALYIEGLILLRGLDRPAPAITAFRGYLDAAPFGEQRQSAEAMIRHARHELGGPGG
jgi:cytochrome c-type biogenesis protein CcmH/NrfG